MNYERIYNAIITNAQSIGITENITENISENHHIIPRCMGGTDDSDNLIRVTPESHYVLHQLLVKMYPSNSQLIYAANMMTVGRTNNKQYGWLKRKYIHECRKRIGDKNPSYGTCWINDGLSVKKIKITDLNEWLDTGWVRGRKITPYPSCIRCGAETPYYGRSYCETCWGAINDVHFREYHNLVKRIKSKHNKIRKSEAYMKARAKKWYTKFNESSLSLREFAKQHDLVAMTLSHWFRKYIDEYDIKPRISAAAQK